jgi:hypothetical protein
MKKVLLSGFLLCGLSFNLYADNCVTGNNSLPSTLFNKANGYTLLNKNDGVCLYKKDGKNIYAQVIDLSSGAKVTFGISDYQGKEILGNGKNAKMYSKDTISTHFINSSSENQKLTSVINAQFFDTNRDPTFLSFPLKSNFSYISEGPDMRDWPADNFRMLRIHKKPMGWRGNKYLAGVYPYWNENQFASFSGDVIVGLNPNVRKGSTYTQRTFVAPIGSYSSENFPVLVFLVSLDKVKQSYMSNELTKWGALNHNIIMFDGGGSTQIQNDYGLYHNTGRRIPVVFEISNHN